MSEPDNKLTVEFGGIFQEGNNFVCNIHVYTGLKPPIKQWLGTWATTICLRLNNVTGPLEWRMWRIQEDCYEHEVYDMPVAAEVEQVEALARAMALQVLTDLHEAITEGLAKEAENA